MTKIQVGGGVIRGPGLIPATSQATTANNHPHFPEAIFGYMGISVIVSDTFKS